MRRITLLLIVMATALLAVSGVAWAVTKTCPPSPKKCLGTKGADVLKSTSSDNLMIGGSGNDTYTNFVKGNSGSDQIQDSGGTDKVLLTNYSAASLTHGPLDLDKNGKADSLAIFLDPKGTKNVVVILNYYDNNKSIPNKPGTWTRGPGYIEHIPPLS